MPWTPPSPPSRARASCRRRSARTPRSTAPCRSAGARPIHSPPRWPTCCGCCGWRPAMRVLDVGAGSGWTTALLAHLVGPRGQVHGVERVPELVRFGADNLAATGQPWARIVAAESGVFGLPALAPFDRILVSAEADALPQGLLDQLADGGLMVIPVGGTMQRVQRRGADIDVSEHGGYRFVPLL
ncbi:MAG: methyltransferase domain-containing protein [Ottowia sp.]